MNWRPLLLLLALTSCTTAPGAPGAGLDGTEWLSTAVTEDGADRPLVDGTRLRLDFADGQLGASAGCNTFGGPYRIEDGLLIVEGGAMTEMGCDDERHAQDDWLFGFLGSRPSVAQEGDTLTLSANGTVISLQDREVAEPDLPLAGTTWTVDSIITGDAVSSVPGGAVATLVFTDTGQVEVDTGCNTGSGAYEVTDGTLRIGQLMRTLAGCDCPSGQLEAAVLAVLNAGDVRDEDAPRPAAQLGREHGVGQGGGVGA